MINTKTDGDVLVVQLPDRIGIGFSKSEFDKLNDILNDWDKKIVLDLSKTKAMDSSAIGIILAKYRTLKDDSKIVLAKLRTVIKQTLDVILIDDFLKIFDSVEEAVEYLKQ